MGTKRPSGGSWASAAEWERYQSTITDMYIDQNLTLNAVIGKMKTEHGFYATGRKIDANDVERHIKRNPDLLRKKATTIDLASSVDRRIVCRTPPRTPPPPEGLRQRHEDVADWYGKKVSLRCEMLGLQCKQTHESHVCSRCLELARKQQERKVLAFSECIRSRLSDVDIFAESLPAIENWSKLFKEAQNLQSGEIALSFKVDWRLPTLVAGAATWLSSSNSLESSKVGILCSYPFVESVGAIVGTEVGAIFWRMLFAMSLVYSYVSSKTLPMPLSTSSLWDIGTLAGHAMLQTLVQQLQPQRLAHAGRDWFEAYFLLLLGTILSVGYTARQLDSPTFPTECGGNSIKPREVTLWDARKEHLCRMLSHYLILVASKLDLSIPLATEKVLGSSSGYEAAHTNGKSVTTCGETSHTNLRSRNPEVAISWR